MGVNLIYILFSCLLDCRCGSDGGGCGGGGGGGSGSGSGSGCRNNSDSILVAVFCPHINTFSVRFPRGSRLFISER